MQGAVQKPCSQRAFGRPGRERSTQRIWWPPREGPAMWGERSLGHQDPGATSFSYLLEVIRDCVAAAE